VIFDLHGSVAALCTAGTTTLSDAYRYDGWGQTIATAGTSANPWKYRGLLGIDPSAAGDKLYDMGARDYAPGTGMFTQLDSVQGSAANPMTMNRFLYALANPATLIDPDGHHADANIGDGGGGGTEPEEQNYCDLHPQRCADISAAQDGGGGGGGNNDGNAGGASAPNSPAPDVCDRGCEQSDWTMTVEEYDERFQSLDPQVRFMINPIIDPGRWITHQQARCAGTSNGRDDLACQIVDELTLGAIWPKPYNLGVVQCVPGGAKPGTLVSSGTDFIVSESGMAVPIPKGYQGEVARNARGLVFREPGSVGDSNILRIGDPDRFNPFGYVRYYDAHGQALDAFGNAVPGRAATHLPLNGGPYPGFQLWFEPLR
jgi:RHS repeat-associated protein